MTERLTVLLKKEALTKMFSSEFCQIFKNTTESCFFFHGNIHISAPMVSLTNISSKSKRALLMFLIYSK